MRWSILRTADRGDLDVAAVGNDFQAGDGAGGQSGVSAVEGAERGHGEDAHLGLAAELVGDALIEQGAGQVAAVADLDQVAVVVVVGGHAAGAVGQAGAGRLVVDEVGADLAHCRDLAEGHGYSPF